jgi:hypothetical protein
MFTWSLVGSYTNDIIIEKKSNNNENFAERKRKKNDILVQVF